MKYSTTELMDDGFLFDVNIENQLHYRRDVFMNEDRCGLRLPNLVHVFAILNNWALDLFAQSGGGNFAAAQRLFNAQPRQAQKLIMQD